MFLQEVDKHSMYQSELFPATRDTDILKRRPFVNESLTIWWWKAGENNARRRVNGKEACGKRQGKAYAGIHEVGHIELFAGLENNGSDPRIVSMANPRKQVMDNLHAKSSQETSQRMIDPMQHYSS